MRGMTRSQLCTRCSVSLGKQAFASRFPRPPSQPAARDGRRNLHTQRPGIASRSQLYHGYSSKRLSSGVGFQAQPPPEAAATAQQSQPKRVLSGDDLFHSFTNSPIDDMRRRAAYIRLHANCPHPDHRPTRVAESVAGQPVTETGDLPPAHVDFECPDCGVPVYCSQEHWEDDYERHLQICDTLRQINEDDHDLRSGRLFPEFEYAGPQMEEALVNMTNWDTFLYTRNFVAINADRSMRHATRLLTYPVTVASVLHELSPYSLRSDERLTTEGLKSFSGKFCKPGPRAERRWMADDN